MCKYRVIGITVRFDIFIIVSQMFQQIEEHGKCMLRNGFRRITGNISPGDSALVEIILVQIVRTCCSDAYQFQILGSTDGRFIYLYFINDNDIGIFYAFRYFFGCRKCLARDIADCIKTRQIDIIADSFCI